ncbi:GNAT family N-acetyltransferase [Sphingobacterium zeae]|uniref:GNAT family acetyltransferase n=1 Tax=Sphingobacterium zeae TaxID=1776859 RepID=A0ABU0U4W0_9SPHI|nr:GNAT family N-acetyltransferase [Sphingobacterium zeae]MDQ1150007.1 putative GNAT family acetyltransferase [Sphingobacterium zeae]
MEIKNIETDEKGNFVAEIENNEAGILEYTWQNDHEFSIDHTEVYEEYRGMSVGKKLVLEAVDYARKNDAKIVPNCPYAKAIFEKTIAFQDVLA